MAFLTPFLAVVDIAIWRALWLSFSGRDQRNFMTDRIQCVKPFAKFFRDLDDYGSSQKTKEFFNFASSEVHFHPVDVTCLEKNESFSCDFKFVLNSLKSFRRDSDQRWNVFISTHWYSTLQSLQIKSLCHATSFAIIHFLSFLLCHSHALFGGFEGEKRTDKCTSWDG